MGRAPLPTLASKREGCRLRAWHHLPSRGKKLPVNGADSRKQLRGRMASPSDLEGLKHAGNQLYHWTLQLTEPLGVGSSRGCYCSLIYELDPGNWKILPASSLLRMYVLSTVPTVGLFWRTQPWESSVWLRPSGWSTWLNPVKASL